MLFIFTRTIVHIDVALHRSPIDAKVGGYLTLALTLSGVLDYDFLFCVHTYHVCNKVGTLKETLPALSMKNKWHTFQLKGGAVFN